MTQEIKRLVMTALTGLISLLLAGNIFFVARLVDKVDQVSEAVWHLRQQVAVLEASKPYQCKVKDF